MMSAEADIRGNVAALEQARANLNATITGTNLGSLAGLQAVGPQLVALIKRMLSHPGTGAIYRRRGVTHQASAEGEPPAVDTGRLRASYTYKTGRLAGEQPYLDVGTNVKYAPHLEFGTRNMTARPHFRPAIEQFKAADFSKVVAERIVAHEKKVIQGLRASGRNFGKLL